MRRVKNLWGEIKSAGFGVRRYVYRRFGDWVGIVLGYLYRNDLVAGVFSQRKVLVILLYARKCRTIYTSNYIFNSLRLFYQSGLVVSTKSTVQPRCTPKEAIAQQSVFQ